jgi:hypothetical protein
MSQPNYREIAHDLAARRRIVMNLRAFGLEAHPGRSALIVAVLVALSFVINATSSYAKLSPQISWLITAGVLIAALAVIGSAVNGRLAGVLIDNRNRVSLSKFQAAMWTVLVISALVTASAINLDGNFSNPLELSIPPELLYAMGISAASLVATPSLLSLKTNDPPSSESLARSTEKLNLTSAQVQPAGRVFARTDARLASWADMFRGDETSNAGDADLSKVQQFLISVLLVAIYGAGLWDLFGGSGRVDALPPLSERFVWLMAISHASYLAYKAAPHGTAAAPTTPITQAVG